MFGNGVLGITLALMASMPMAANAQKTQDARMTKPTPTPSATLTPYTPDEMFDKVDRKADGRITRQEMQIFGMENKLGALINTRMWKSVDKDRNGTLSRTEFTDHIKKVRQRSAARKRR